jgi:hypothetical protein
MTDFKTRFSLRRLIGRALWWFIQPMYLGQFDWVQSIDCKPSVVTFNIIKERKNRRITPPKKRPKKPKGGGRAA